MATSTLILPGLLGRTRRQRPDLLLTVNAVQRISEVVELLELEKADVAIAVDYPGLELRHSRAVAHRDIATEPAFVALPAATASAGAPRSPWPTWPRRPGCSRRTTGPGGPRSSIGPARRPASRRWRCGSSAAAGWSCRT